MMKQKELCEWLRANSSGIYRPANEAADEIERLQKAWNSSFNQAMSNGEEANKYKKALNELLNDCINFDGGKLTDIILKQSSDILKT